MITNLCGNCDFSRITTSGVRRCCRFSKEVSETDTCDKYFNYRKTEIYNNLLQNLTKEGNER